MPSDPNIENLPLSAVTPNPQNVRRHTRRQIAKLARIIEKLGWSAPIVIDETGLILAGHARLEAARLLGRKTVPCVRLTHLGAAEKQALALADNKLTDESSFDGDALRAVLMELTPNIDFDVELTGFDTGEVDFIIDGAGSSAADPADTFAAPEPDQPAVSQRGDLLLLARQAPALLRYRARGGSLRAVVGLGPSPDGVHRRALQCPDSRSRLRPWPPPSP